MMNWIRGSVHDFGLLVVRIVIGSVFMFHGAQKLFGSFDGIGLADFTKTLQALEVPYPQYAAVLVAAAEFVGGLALVSGYWLRPMSLALVATMAGAIVLVHPSAFSAQHNGMEYPLTLAAIAFALSCTGAGRFSLTRLPALSFPNLLAFRPRRVKKTIAPSNEQTAHQRTAAAPSRQEPAPRAKSPPSEPTMPVSLAGNETARRTAA